MTSAQLPFFSRRGLEAQIDCAAALQDLSWVVVRIIADDVRRRPEQLVRRIESRLERVRAA